MIKNGSYPCAAAIGAKLRSLFRLKWFFCLMLTALFTVAAEPTPDEDNPDAQYIRIIAVVDRADALRVSGKADAAKAKYKEALTALSNFKRANPLWYPKTVAYRLTEVSGRIEIHPPAPVPVSAPVKKPVMKIEAEPAVKSNVKLIDAGLEPRKVLRLHVKPGDKQAVTVTVKLSVDMGAAMPANKMPKIPAFSIPADVTVEKVAPNGDVSFQAVVGEGAIAADPNLPPQMAMMAKGMFGTVKGFTVNATLTSRGAMKSISFKAPPGADPKMVEAITKAQQNIPAVGQSIYPEEAVGPGAKWEIKTPVKSQGLTMDQTITVQLVSVEGDNLNTKWDIVSTGSGKPEGQPGNVAVNIPEIKMNMTGNVTHDLSRIAPSQATLDMHMEITSDTTFQGKSRSMTMKADINLGIDTK